jgi:hypothetical protein
MTFDSTLKIIVLCVFCFFNGTGTIVADEVRVNLFNCENTVNREIAAFAKAQGLPLSFFAIDASTACTQAGYGGVIRFRSALDQAYFSFLNDRSDVESPLAIAIEVAYDELGVGRPTTTSSDVPPEVLLHAKNMLMREFQSSPSKLRLIGFGDEHQAERGESVRQAWIFKMKLPHLSDHLYWAIVDRDGQRPVYNYGFN